MVDLMVMMVYLTSQSGTRKWNRHKLLDKMTLC